VKDDDAASRGEYHQRGCDISLNHARREIRGDTHPIA